MPMATSETNTSVVRRLERLLKYLDKQPNEFSRETGLDRSYVTRLLKGTRAGHGGMLHAKVQHTYGIDPKYWTSPTELDPAQCRTRGGPATVATPRLAEVPMTTNPKDIVLETAVQRGDGPDTMMALLRAQPPPGKELQLSWWLALYVDLVTEKQRH